MIQGCQYAWSGDCGGHSGEDLAGKDVDQYSEVSRIEAMKYI
jgi:hypothetical protein